MKNLIIICIFAASIAACGPQKPSSAPAQDVEAEALSLQSSGNYFAAAQAYQALADEYPDKAYVYQLKAADNFLQGDSMVNAKSILDQVQIPETDKNAQLQQAVLLGKYYDTNQQAQQSLNALDVLPPLDAPTDLLKQYHELRANAFLALNNELQSVNELLLLESYLSSPSEKEAIHSQIWQSLIALPNTTLKSQTLSGSPSSVAWFELASIYMSSQFDPVRLRGLVTTWQNQHPNHPANYGIIPEFMEKSMLFAGEAKTIALILPFTGPYKNASSAIREGLTAAWYEQRSESTIKIYDANSLNITSIYQQAVTEGAEIVIGPLEKEAIKALINQGPLSVKTIVLNRVDDIEIEDSLLFQFALSPEDEAKQVAKRAIEEGHKTAIVIRPNNNWGERVYDSFAEELTLLGGEVLDQVAFDTSSRELSSPVKSILDIDASNARGKQLRAKLGRKIYTETRSRKDADFIFTAGTGNMGTLLLPQLWFFQASPLPMYATSHMYSGTRNKTANMDLNGLKIVDIPWILEPKHEASLIQDGLNRNWNQNNSSLRRLYAFGIDTFKLINELGKMSSNETYTIQGETGYLWMNKQRQIHRNLSWATIADGEPVLDKAASF